MKKSPLIGILVFCTGLFAAQVEIGMTEAALVQQKGQPTSKLTVGAKAIYQWPDVSVTMNGGRVESFKIVESPAKKQGDATRQRAKTGTGPARNTEGNGLRTNSRSTNESVDPADAEERRLSGEIAKKQRITQLQAQIRAMESQLDAAAKRNSVGKKSAPMSADEEALLRLRLEKTKRELEKLR